MLILGEEFEVRDSYDHVEVYPRNFAPEKPKRSKLNNDFMRGGYADNNERDMTGTKNLVSLGSCC